MPANQGYEGELPAQHRKVKGAPPADGPSNMYPSEPGLTAMSPLDPNKPSGVPNPNGKMETGMSEGHPAFGRGSGN